MSQVKRSVPLLVAGVCLIFGGFVVSAQDKKKKGPTKNQRPARALKLGVVDIGVLFKSYKRKDSLEEVINERRKAMTEDLKKEAEKIKDMRRRLDMGGVREGSEMWLRAGRDIQIEQYKLQLKKEMLQASLKKQVEKHTLQILTELQKTIATYGKKYGYDLILKIDNEGRGKGEEGDGESLVAHFQEAIFRAQISDVLYFNDRALNITKNVESLLNSAQNMRKMAREAPK